VYSKAVHMGLKTEQANELADELSLLSKEHANALENAAYIQMTEEVAAHYDLRAKRIKEICTLLGIYQPL
jgi:hypothetical protein